MKRRPAVAAAVTTLAVIAAGACGDDLVAPDADIPPPLAATAAEREQMLVDLLFAQEQSATGLERGKSLTAALASLGGKVERNDRHAVERELIAARAVLQQYRDAIGGNNAVDPDLEAFSLTLDQVALLATTSRSQERQP